MKITVDSRIRVEGATPGEVRNLKALAEQPNPLREGLARMRASLRQRPFDARLRGAVARLESEPEVLRLWREEGRALTLPRGLLDHARNLVSFGAVVVDTASGAPELSEWLPGDLSLRRELWAHQARAAGACAAAGQGICRAATGSGKTVLALALLVRYALPTLVLVPSVSLAEQWVRAALKEVEGLLPEHVGVVGDGRDEVRPLTVAVVHSLASDDCRRAKELARTFGLLLFDEVYGAAAKTRYEVVDASAARYRFAFGDDERRKDDLECLTYAAFGAVLDTTTRAEAEACGAIVPVRVRLVETGVEPPGWWGELEGSARAMRTGELIRHLEEDVDRAALVAALTVRAAREGQVLVFGHHVDHVQRMHADALAADEGAVLSGHTAFFLGGQKMKRDRRDATDRLLAGELRAAFATYKALGKGVDLPSVTRALLATPIHNDRDGVNQALGRLCRGAEGKDAPEAVVLYDEKVFGAAPVRAYMRGGREVVVECAGGRVLTVREYLQEGGGDGEQRKRQSSAREFFDKL